MSRKSFLLRISPRLYQELESWAQREMRSVNGQMEYLLRDAVERHRRKPIDAADDDGIGDDGAGDDGIGDEAARTS